MEQFNIRIWNLHSLQSTLFNVVRARCDAARLIHLYVYMYICIYIPGIYWPIHIQMHRIYRLINIFMHGIYRPYAVQPQMYVCMLQANMLFNRGSVSKALDKYTEALTLCPWCVCVCVCVCTCACTRYMHIGTCLHMRMQRT